LKERIITAAGIAALIRIVAIAAAQSASPRRGPDNHSTVPPAQIVDVATLVILFGLGAELIARKQLYVTARSQDLL